MKIRVLGCNGGQLPGYFPVSFFINDHLILDAGSITSHLSLKDQHKIREILITHGHLDHTFSVLPHCQGYGIPAYIHSEDRILLTHPEQALSAVFAATLGETNFYEPSDVRELRNGEELEFLGMTLRAIHAPGHTRGSLIFTIADEVVITGDVLFAGSIGRTDQPTGSPKDMENTLRKKIWPLPDQMRVLPGHGPETTIGHERRTNPYLRNLKNIGRSA